MKLFVEIADLRRALQALTPHMDPKDELGVFGRIRGHATDGNLFLMATDRYTAAMAVVSLWDKDDLTGSIRDDALEFSVQDVKEILTLFRAPRRKDEPEGDLLIETSPGGSDPARRLVDVSGLFPGKEFRLPGADVDEKFPNLARVMSRRPAPTRTVRSNLTFAGEHLKKFLAASKAYEQPITLQPVAEGSNMMLVAVGESFRGMIAGWRWPEDKTPDFEGWDMQWRLWSEELLGMAPDLRRPEGHEGAPADGEERDWSAALEQWAKDLAERQAKERDDEDDEDAPEEDPDEHA